MDQLPAELLGQICSVLDPPSVASVCLASRDFHSSFQPLLLRSRHALDRAYKWSVIHDDVSLFRQVASLGKYANISALCLAAKHGQAGIVRELLQNKDICDIIVSSKSPLLDSWGHPLTVAVRAGHADVVRLFLDLPAIEIDQTNLQKYRAPLRIACRRVDGPEVLNMFIKRGVNLRLLHPGRATLFINELQRCTWAIASRLKEAGATDSLTLADWLEYADQFEGYMFRSGWWKHSMRRMYEIIAPTQLRLHPTQLPMLVASGVDFSFIEDNLALKPDLSAKQGIDLLMDMFRFRGSEAEAPQVVRLCQLLVSCGEKLNDSAYFTPKILQYTARHCAATALLEILLQVPACPSPSAALGHVRTPEAVKFLLSRGASIKATTQFNETPLIEYIFSVNTFSCTCEKAQDEGKGIRLEKLSTAQEVREMVSLFLANGADPSVVTDEGNTAMSLAIWSCAAEKEVLQMLIDHGARVAPGPEDPLNFCHILPKVLELPRDRRIDFAKWLLSKGALIDGQDEMGETALFKAARVLDAELVEFLLAHGASVQQPNPENNSSENILFMAGVCTRLTRVCGLPLDYGESIIACTRMLMSAGATLQESPDDGLLSWCGAFNTRHLQLYLDQGLSVNAQLSWIGRIHDMPIPEQGDLDGTMLHYAVEKHDMDFVRFVLSHGADPHARNTSGQTPWQHAVRFWEERMDLMGRLLKKPSTFLDDLRKTAVYVEDEPCVFLRRNSM